MDTSYYLDVGIQAVKAAEKVISKYYAQKLEPTTKSDLSPVTIADTEAEQVIRSVISHEFPDHGFIGEEEGRENGDSEYQWVIDPIDGTKNFIREIPLFTTELALFYKNDLIIGISNNPINHELYTAQKGKGAYLNLTNALHVKTGIALEDSYMSYGGIKYFDKIHKVNHLLKLAKKCKATRSFGESLQYRFLAQGKIDIVLEADARIWDIAAVACIISEAGAKVTDLRGDPFTVNSSSLLAASPRLHSQVVDLLNSSL